MNEKTTAKKALNLTFVLSLGTSRLIHTVKERNELDYIPSL